MVIAGESVVLAGPKTLLALHDAAASLVPDIRAQAAKTDTSATFPTDAVDALRRHGLMGLTVPVEYGGAGGDLGDLAAIASMLGGACTSTAMIWAMHCQQVDCVVRFAGPQLRAEVLPRIAAGEIYLASVTTEPGKGGHLLSGQAALEQNGAELAFRRTAPIITGGQRAEAFLVTMRDSPEAADQRVTLVYAWADQLQKSDVGTWNTLGMRGTESAGMALSGSVPPHQVIGAPGDFRTVAVESMIPAGHIGWAAVWLGAARAVLSGLLTTLRAQRTTLSELKAERIARARIDLEMVAAYLAAVRDEVLHHRRAGTSLAGTATQIHLNNLKVIAAEHTYQAVDRLIEVAGLFKGYSHNDALPLERVFRDLRSASLNFSNDRLLTMNGALTLLDREVTFVPSLTERITS